MRETDAVRVWHESRRVQAIELVCVGGLRAGLEENGIRAGLGVHDDLSLGALALLARRGVYGMPNGRRLVPASCYLAMCPDGTKGCGRANDQRGRQRHSRHNPCATPRRAMV